MRKSQFSILAVILSLVIGSVMLYPHMAKAGDEKSLVSQVEQLHLMVSNLTARLEELEEGGGCLCSNNFEILHFDTLADFPIDPLEGDMCVVQTIVDEIGYNNLYIYLNGDWKEITFKPTAPPPPPPPPEY